MKRMLYFIVAFLSFSLLFTSNLCAQSYTVKTITGIVREEDGTVSPGIAVMVQGTTNATMTDENGKFTLKVRFNNSQEGSKKLPVLIFSCLGKETQEITCDKTHYEIVMKDVYNSLIGAIISTGYQKIDRRLSASAVTTINAEDVLQGNASTLDNMLQGKLPGLSVVNSSSTPGASSKVRIRGTSSIAGNREPLWVVDGVIQEDPVNVSTDILNNLDDVNLLGNAISGLNPNDIEKIDVLKDASSTAIYGVKAANGVIVVTTKKGTYGKPRITYSGNLTVTERPSYRRLNLMNSKDRIDVSKEIAEKGLAYSFEPARVGYEGLLFDYYDKKITEEQFLNGVSRIEAINTDWFDILFHTSVSHKHNLSVSGANDRVNYYVSGSVIDDNANVKGTGLTQYNILSKVNVKLAESLRGTVQVRGSIIDKEYLHSSISPYQYAYNTSRAIPLYNEDGSLLFYNASTGFNAQPLTYNILNEIQNSGRNIRTDALNFNANLDWNIWKGFRATGMFAMNVSNTNDKEWFSDRSYQAALLRRTNYGEPFPNEERWKTDMCELPYGGKLKNSSTRNHSWTARLQLDYTKTIKSHYVSVVAGYEARSSKYTGLVSTQYGYLPSRGESFVNINPIEWPKYSELITNTPDIVTNRISNYMSFYGIFSYSWKSRYIINGNIRADGSNKFGQDKSTRFLPIWSVSAKWNLMNEPFMKKAKWLDELSFKASYGIQGNVSPDQTPSMIIKLGSIDPTSGEYISTLSKLPNPYLKWEKTNSFNVAMDFSLFQNRLSGTLEYYHKYGHDQIVPVQVVSTTGSKRMMLNVGDITNEGVEFIINAVPVKTKNFRWSISFNTSKNTNKVTRGGMVSEYSYTHYINGSAVIEGMPINSFFSYKFAGLDKNGLPEFKDIEESDGTTKEEMYKKAFAYSGNRLPDMQGGLSTNFNFYGVTIGLFFSYSIGSKIRLNNLYNNSGQRLPNPQQNMSAEFNDRWRQPGDELHTNIPALSTEPLSMKAGALQDRKIEIANNKWQMYNQSDIRVASGDFLRLKTAYIKYNLPRKACQKMKISNFAIRLEGNNLWLVCDKKLNGQDPEQIGFGSFSLATPPVSAFTFGLDITF